MTLELLRLKQDEEPEAYPHFSFSQLNTFMICPMKYNFQYIERVQWETKPVALPFGKGIHKAAETYYRNLMETGEIIPVDQVISIFEAVFNQDIQNSEIEITFKEGENPKTLREKGIELLKLFHSEIKPQRTFIW